MNHCGAGTTPKFHCSIAGLTDEDGELIRYKVKPHFKGQEKDRRNGEIYGELCRHAFRRRLAFSLTTNGSLTSIVPTAKRV